MTNPVKGINLAVGLLNYKHAHTRRTVTAGPESQWCYSFLAPMPWDPSKQLLLPITPAMLPTTTKHLEYQQSLFSYCLVVDWVS